MAEKPKLPIPPKPPAFPSGIKPSTLPGATKAVKQYTTPAGPKAPVGVMGSSYVPGRTSNTFNPASLTKSNRQVVETIQQRGATGVTPGTDKGTGKGTGTDKGTKTKTILRTEDNGDGTYTIYYSDGTTETGGTKIGGAAEDPALQYQRDVEAANRKSAFQILADEFTQRGLPTLATEVERFMKEGLTPAEARISIRNTQAYKDRFKGNEGRIKKGLAVYQPDEYLAAEETYRNLLLANNLQDLISKNTTDSFISGAVSAQEVQDRIQNVFNKIDNADPTLKSQVSQYFSNFGIADPNLQRTQLASALLTGETSSMALERQLKKAQLRAGAALADVTIAETGVESLQKQLEAQNVSDVYGVAKTGFSTLAQTQRETERLGGIYGAEQAPMAEELQQEAFFGLQSQRRKKLQERERATFGGQAGISTAGLARGTAGSF
jgi:hypothetical protein